MYPAKYFKQEEFECKCGCGTNNVDDELVQVLDYLRTVMRKPIVITSGLRCEAHNTAVGGAQNSQHLSGKAADIKVIGLDPETVYTYLDNKYFDKYGIGLYKSWVHLDVRPEKARWKK
jgi:uncharacterized protein YcbK (DUF882 family)